jgi:hypothetical protein
MTTATQIKLTAAIRKLVESSTYYLEGGREIQAVSFSHLLSELRYSGWKNLGSNVSDFDTLVRSLGFKVSRGQCQKNGKPFGRLARIVTL